MALEHPWLEWQTNGSSRINLNQHELRSCPFCSKLHLSLQFGFDGKAGRVECRNCSAQGPWAWGATRKSVIEGVVRRWNESIEDGD